MASSGPLYAGTAANDTSIGSYAWTSIAGLTGAANGSGPYIDSTTDGSTPSNYAKATNFGFAIPTGATIDGIVVEWDKFTNSSIRAKDYAVRIVKGGTIGSTDKSVAGAWPNPSAYAWVSHGSSSDLWGETWSYSDINDSTFGAAIAPVANGSVQLNASLDAVRITVYYTAAAGGQATAKRWGGVRFATGIGQRGAW